MTTSVYNYITTAQLEAYTGIDYATTSATYTDIFVEANITIAERAVNSMCNTTPSSTSDGVIMATMILSERFMRNVMIIDGFATETPINIKKFLDELIKLVLKPDVYKSVDTVFMSGADK